MSKLLNFKLQFHSVVGQSDLGRQFRIRFFMREVVTDVREKRALRFDLVHDSQRLLDGGMRGMRLVAQRIQEKNVEVAQFVERLRRHGTVVGEVSAGPEAET